MGNVSVSEVKVVVAIDGEEMATFEFNRTDRNPQNWEVTAAINHRDAKSAMRACLLACVAELAEGIWEPYTFEAESDSSTDDQPQLFRD